MKKILALTIFLSLYAYLSNAQKNNTIDAGIKKCIELNVKNSSAPYFDLYKLYITIEETLIEEHLLNNKSKESYKKLFDEFESNKENDAYKKNTLKYMIF